MYYQNYASACKKMQPFWQTKTIPSMEIQCEYNIALDSLRKYLDKFVGAMPTPKYICLLCRTAK